MGKGGQGKGNWYNNNNNSWGWNSSWHAPRPFPYAQYGAPAYNSQMGSVANNLDAALGEVCSLGKLVQVGSALNAAGFQQSGGNGASPSMTQALTTPAAPAASADKDVATKLMEKFDKVAEHFTKPASPPVVDTPGARSSHDDERINSLIENHASIKSMRREVSDVKDEVSHVTSTVETWKKEQSSGFQEIKSMLGSLAQKLVHSSGQTPSHTPRSVASEPAAPARVAEPDIRFLGHGDILKKPMTKEMHANFIKSVGLRKDAVTVVRAAKTIEGPDPSIGDWWDIMFATKRMPTWTAFLEIHGPGGDFDNTDDVIFGLLDMLNPDFTLPGDGC